MRRTIVLMLGALLLTRTVLAGEGDFSNREARARFDEGVALVRQGQFQAARVKFQQTLALEKRAAVLINLAVCEKNLGLTLEAAEHLDAYVKDPNVAPERRESVARELLEPLRRKLGQLKIVAPPGSTIVLDGRRTLGAAPLVDAVIVAPGDHECEATGDRTRELRVHVDAGQVVEVNLEAAPPRPDAIERYRPMAGYVVPLALAGAGVVALGFGAGFALDSQSKRSDATAQSAACSIPASDACSNVRSLHQSQTAEASAAVGLYVAGGILAAAGVVSFLVWPASTRVHVMPVVGTRTGLWLSVDF